MRPSVLSAVFLSTAFAFVATAHAQGTKADYQRAADLLNITRGKADRERVEPHWFDDNRQFWYRIPTAVDRYEFVVVEAEKGARQPAFDHQRMAEALSKAGVANARADRLPI